MVRTLIRTIVLDRVPEVKDNHDMMAIDISEILSTKGVDVDIEYKEDAIILMVYAKRG